MFTNLSIEEATIAYIIRAYKSFDNTISQYGIADAYTQRQMINITPRRVRKLIEKLIEKGYPIISTPHKPGGYCWFSYDSERLECYRRLRKKGIRILLRARRINRNCKAEMDKREEKEQLSLLGVG